MTRTPEERERMYALLFDTMCDEAYPRWVNQSETNRHLWRGYCDRLLTTFPQLWDSLPPSPAEQARKEAEEDWRMLESWRVEPGHYCLPIYRAVDLADRMTARAAAGYPVLTAPTGKEGV